MTDYDKASGLGTLRIRDLGSTVEFWVKPYYSDFWWNGLSFTVTANGSSTNYSINISGNSWYKVTSRTISSSQTVTFKLNTATGTQSLGGPTTFSQYIDRATVPPIPDPVTFSLLTSTSVRTNFTNNGNGGASLDGWQIGRNTVNSASTSTVVNCGSDQSYDWSGLAPGTTYYFWSRVHNAKGWSGWAATRSVKTLNVPSAPSQPVASNVTQKDVYITFTDGANNGASIDSRQIAWNTSNTLTGATIVSSDGSTQFNNLPPGGTLYFWARTHNSVGYSAWSAVRQVILVAGSYLVVNGVKTRAVPWYNDNGTWKVLKPWNKVAGVWKESI